MSRYLTFTFMRLEYFRHLVVAVIVVSMAACSSDGEKTEESTSELKEETKETKRSVSTSGSPSVTWSCEMLGMYSHSGTAELSHTITTDENGHITGGSFTVDMNSIVAIDENFNPEEGKTKEKLVEHLQSADFFDAANFPTATFEITSVDNDSQVIEGNMTIKGVTQVEKAEFRGNGNGSAFKARLNLNRQKYGLTWQHPVKENVLSDDIKIRVEIKL